MTYKNLLVGGKNYWWHYFYTPTKKGYTLEVMPEREPARKVRLFCPGKEKPIEIEELVGRLVKQII